LIKATAFTTPRELASYVFLLGMIGICAGAWALRDSPLQPPQPPVVIATQLSPPRVDSASPGTLVLSALPVAGAKPPRPLPPTIAQPQLDSAAVSSVSRVYLGPPAAVPANWLSRAPAVQASSEPVKPPTTRPSLRPASFQAAVQQGVQPPVALIPRATLRPRLRPASFQAAVQQAVQRPVTPISRATLRPRLRPAIFQAAVQQGVQPPVTPISRATLRPRLRPDGLASPAPAAIAAVPALGVVRQGACRARLVRAVPRRAGSAASAEAVLARVQDVDRTRRDRVLEAEIRGGNMPAFLRNLVPVTLTGPGPDGKKVQITLCVMPDYLAIGDDQNFVRVPFGLPSARRIATDFNMVLPTPQMVDLIYRASDVRLQPSPMPPGGAMTTTSYFQRHNTTVEAQRRASGGAVGLLVSGHKKDVVLTHRLSAAPGRVAIYGWHRRNGKPIQPLSTVHGAQYADYSHGIRLISRNAVLDGRQVDLLALIQDPSYAALLTKEGPMSPRLFAAR